MNFWILFQDEISAVVQCSTVIMPVLHTGNTLSSSLVLSWYAIAHWTRGIASFFPKCCQYCILWTWWIYTAYGDERRWSYGVLNFGYRVAYQVLSQNLVLPGVLPQIVGTTKSTGTIFWGRARSSRTVFQYWHVHFKFPNSIANLGRNVKGNFFSFSWTTGTLAPSAMGCFFPQSRFVFVLM